MPRVLIDYEDGHYSMYKVTDEQSEFVSDRWSVSITDQEWEEYEAFNLQLKYWYERCRTLSNIIYDRNKEPTQ